MMDLRGGENWISFMFDGRIQDREALIFAFCHNSINNIMIMMTVITMIRMISVEVCKYILHTQNRLNFRS